MFLLRQRCLWVLIDRAGMKLKCRYYAQLAPQEAVSRVDFPSRPPPGRKHKMWVALAQGQPFTRFNPLSDKI
jgi:hypothetical protein